MRTKRHEHRRLIGIILGAFVTFIAVLALTLTLTPSLASAETPAQRCKRETTAYNNAWKAIGKKPPVPYKCGGNNQPPPTLPPATSEDRPDTTSGPTTSAPKTGGNGPSMDAPTERRDIQHPGTNQAPIDSGSSPSAENPASTHPVERNPRATPRPEVVPGSPSRRNSLGEPLNSSSELSLTRARGLPVDMNDPYGITLLGCGFLWSDCISKGITCSISVASVLIPIIKVAKLTRILEQVANVPQSWRGRSAI